MSAQRFGPRRRLRSEVLPISMVLAIPLALAWVFPYSALSPVPKDLGGIRTDRTFYAFVDLDEDEEARAMAAARTAWHVNSEGVKKLRIEMFADDLPDDASGVVVDVDQRTRVSRGSAIPYEPTELPSDLRAPAPTVLDKPEPPVKPQPFPREEMLKLD